MSRRLRAVLAMLLLGLGGFSAACSDDNEKGAPGGEPVPTSTKQSTTTALPGNSDPSVPGGSVPPDSPSSTP
ncbi:MAG TPA: hypothetical protein VM030_04110 [Acidimicrobiales bacterium]|nr:hypothetical protein [Acidimicrobiales bacterium]